MSDIVQAGQAAGPLSPVGFSYASLEPAQAGIAQASAAAIREIHKRAIPAIGRHLLAAKEALPHGAFTQWAEQELGINARSARNYMQAASWLIGKPATVAVLPPTVLYALSAPGVPDDVVQGVLIEAASGAPLNPIVIQAKLIAAKAEQVELQAEQRRKPGLTAEDLRVKKKRREQRSASERAREDARRAAEKQERADRLAPIVDELFAVTGSSVLGAVVKVLENWDDRYVFIELLRAAAVGGAA